MTPFLLIAFAAFALLAWHDLRKAFLLFCAILPTYLIRFTVLGIPTTALEAAFWILFIIWMLRREKRFVDIRGWRLFLLAWVAVATVAAFVSPVFREAAGVWKAYFIEPALFFILANDLLRSEPDREAALRSLAWCAIAIGLSAIIQVFTLWGVPPPWNMPGLFRATSFFGFPNAIGLFMAPLVPLFWTFRKKKIFMVALGACVIAILLAQSEGAAIGATAAILMLGLADRRSRKAIIVAFVTAAVVVMVLPTRAKVIENLSLHGWSGRVRTEMWGEAWNMLKDHAIFGAGLSGYPIVFKPYHKATWIEIFQYPHDIILNFWTEMGIVGPILLVIFIILLTRTILAAWRKSDADARNWILALAASFIAIFVHGLVDVPYFKNDLAMEWWLLVAMIVSIRAETGGH